MFCPKCGTDAGKGKYCPNCGANVYDPSFAPGIDYPDPNAKKVNKLAYGLIAILLGGLGIHRFYAGKIWSGIFYILFSWTGVPSVLGIIEGIIALCKKDEDEHGNITVDPDSFFV